MAEASADGRTVSVVRLAAEDWQAYRSIRLAMLQESPAAFGSTHAEAAAYDEELWRQRLSDNAIFLARVDQAPAGSAVYSEFGATGPDDCALYGMWVDPGCRGSGVGRSLVESVVARARAMGKHRVVLHVVAGNGAARRLYERAGFVATGRTIPYPHDAQILEVEMELVLIDASGSTVPA